MTQDQEKKIREEFDERFTEHNLRDDLSEQKVARYIKDWFITKMKEQIEIAVRETKNDMVDIIALHQREYIDDLKLVNEEDKWQIIQFIAEWKKHTLELLSNSPKE